MLKNLLSLTLIPMLCALTVSARAAPPQQNRNERALEKVKEKVRKIGIGEKARAEVRLRDGIRLKGYIREAGEESFVIMDTHSGSPVSVDYSDVKQIKAIKPLTAAKVGITIAKGAAILGGVIGGLIVIGLIFIPKT